MFLLLAILCYLPLFENTWNEYPSHLHAWTQSDRLAIAQRFQEEDARFFYPKTYNLLTKDGITQVDLPLIEYISATISKILKINIVKTFRILQFLLSFIALLFLFKSALAFSIRPIRAVFITYFIYTLPFFVYYQNGFLPSSTAFSLLIIALYFVICYHKTRKVKYSILSFFLLTLSALLRSPFLIFLVAYGLLLGLNQIKRRQINPLEVLLFLLSLSLFFSYAWYKSFLSEEYGSMFLQKALPIQSLTEGLSVLRKALERWHSDWLSPFHAIILLLIVGFGFWQWRQKSKKDWGSIFLFQFFGIASLGVLAFLLLFGTQLVDHDYYYIDTLLPLLVLLLLVLGKNIQISKSAYVPVFSLCLLFFFYFFSYAKEIQVKRYTPEWNDKIDYAYEVYEQAKKDAEKWGIQSEDTLSILEAYSTNIPLSVFKNQGYTCLTSDPDSVQRFIAQKADYYLMLDSFFRMDAYRNYPGIIEQLEKVDGNGELSVYQLNANKNKAAFFDYLYFSGDFDFDTSIPSPQELSNPYNVVKPDFHENQAFEIKPEAEYNLTLSDSIKIKDLSKPLHCLIVADYYQVDSISRFQLVYTLDDIYKVHYTENTFKEVNQWQSKQYRFSISPDRLKDKMELKFYFWNPIKRQFYIDNLHYIIYQ